MNLVNREFTIGKMHGIKNNKGVSAEKYLPRKCSATSRILGPGDRSSIQITVPQVDPVHGTIISGRFEDVIAISGYIRTKGRSDWEIEKIMRAKGIYPVQESE